MEVPRNSRRGGIGGSRAGGGGHADRRSLRLVPRRVVCLDREAVVRPAGEPGEEVRRSARVAGDDAAL